MPNKYFFAAAFAHRHNLDGTWDSICTKCFLTIATERSEDRLLMNEHRHDCDSLMKARGMSTGFPEPLRGAGAILNKRPSSACVKAEDEPN
jgi:hypothetical protein